MKRFELKRTLLGADITAQITVLDEGVQVSVFGGTRPHIGAVSVVNMADKMSTTQFPGHRDGVVSRAWAKALMEAGYSPVVVTAGIHYDQIGKAGICMVLDLNDGLICSALEKISDPID